MSYFIIRRSFHHSYLRSLIIRVPETKLGLFNYNEFAIYPPSNQIQSPLPQSSSSQSSSSQSSSSQRSSSQSSSSQSSSSQSSIIQSKPSSSHILPSLPNLAVPESYIHKSS